METTNRKRLEELLKESKEFLQDVVDSVRALILVLDSDMRVISASRAFYKDFKVGPNETVGVHIKELGNGQWDIPEFMELISTMLPEKREIHDYKVIHTFEDIGERTILLDMKELSQEESKECLIFISMEDITEEMGKRENES